MFRFLLVKYISLGLQSCRALLLAALLGPSSYGIFGTLVLVQQYLSYSALGVREGLTVKLAHAHDDSTRALTYCSSALFWAFCVGAAVLIGSVVAAGTRTALPVDWLLVGVISCLSITNEIFININRDQNRIVKVAVLEVVFNALPLLVALILGRSITVTAVLASMAVGLSLSVIGYSIGPRYFRWQLVERTAVVELVKLGVPMALLSLATTALTGIFVFAAGAMAPGRTVGLLVFANSLCMILLFGLNMIAWAATSQSMKRLHATNCDEATGERSARITSFFRLGFVLAVSSLLCAGFAFHFVLQSYAGSEVFAVYLCLLQAYALLLYREFNFLAVKGCSLVIATGYAVLLLAIVGAIAFWPQLGLIRLLHLSLLLLCMLSFACIVYCRRLGFVDPSIRAQCGFLAFPPLFGGLYAAAGAPGAAAVAIGFVIGWLILYKDASLPWSRVRPAG